MNHPLSPGGSSSVPIPPQSSSARTEPASYLPQRPIVLYRRQGVGGGRQRVRRRTASLCVFRKGFALAISVDKGATILARHPLSLYLAMIRRALLQQHAELPITARREVRRALGTSAASAGGEKVSVCVCVYVSMLLALADAAATAGDVARADLH